MCFHLLVYNQLTRKDEITAQKEVKKKHLDLLPLIAEVEKNS